MTVCLYKARIHIGTLYIHQFFIRWQIRADILNLSILHQNVSTIWLTVNGIMNQSIMNNHLDFLLIAVSIAR